MIQPHTFHIPVMGIGFTIDTPLKVAPYGISSVISLGDDWLLERMREFYSKKLNLPFEPITRDVKDGRAKRITAYLNLMKKMVDDKFDQLKNSEFEKGTEISKYFEMLPANAPLKKEYDLMMAEPDSSIKKEKQELLRKNLVAGEIDVNVMTKLDKTNFTKNGEQLPQEMNDAHAALRGFANSDLSSGIVLSAGLSPRLYSYISNFEDFFPNENGVVKKKIILKVSDYRSALVQGKFLAKKGIWVTEYRVESGLNCGGHAFATDGFLMGPILEEFKQNREELTNQIHQVLNEALESMGRTKLSKPMEMLVTAQGGVGTNEEHEFLLHHYKIDKIGWGTPFLLVPEAINIDENTLNLLSDAEEDDLYLSDISPIGVPFNTVKGNTKDVEKEVKIAEGKPGSSCPSQFLKLYNTEFTETPICLASRQYQKLKIKELDEQNLPQEEYKTAFDKITTKSCLCAGLVMTAYSENNLLKKSDGVGTSVCPGPNMAYFSKKSSLQEMVDHIYGKINILNDMYRPHMFIKEMGMYIDYLNNKIEETKDNITTKQKKYLETFIQNLQEGNNYYQNLFESLKNSFEDTKADLLKELELAKNTLNSIHAEIESLSSQSVSAN